MCKFFWTGREVAICLKHPKMQKAKDCISHHVILTFSIHEEPAERLSVNRYSRTSSDFECNCWRKVFLKQLHLRSSYCHQIWNMPPLPEISEATMLLQCNFGYMNWDLIQVRNKIVGSGFLVVTLNSSCWQTDGYTEWDYTFWILERPAWQEVCSRWSHHPTGHWTNPATEVFVWVCVTVLKYPQSPHMHGNNLICVETKNIWALSDADECLWVWIWSKIAQHTE